MKDELFCEVRFSEDETRQSPGILRGVLMPYGQRAADRPEVFELGALEWPAEGVLVRRMHDRKSPLVKVIPFLDGTDLRIDSPLLNSAAGRSAAEELRGRCSDRIFRRIQRHQGDTAQWLAGDSKGHARRRGPGGLPFILGCQSGATGQDRHPGEDSAVMAVSIDVTQLAQGMMLVGATGGVVDTPVEPMRGRLERFLLVASFLVSSRTMATMPDQVADEIAIKLSTYWWNMPPAARMSGYANAWVNSGAGTVAADWTQRQTAAGL